MDKKISFLIEDLYEGGIYIPVQRRGRMCEKS